MLGTKIAYYAFILPLSILPFPILYGLSSFFFLIVYYVIGYRKTVVRTNMAHALPHLSEKERRKAERKFYAHLCDLGIESLKFFTISEKQVRKRLQIENPELVDQFAKEGRSVVMAGGHYNSWELYALGMPFYHQHKAIALYKPISNKFFNQKMKATRERFGMTMVAMEDSGTYFGRKDEAYAFILATDQSPSNPERAFWMDFLHQDTAMLRGTETYARRFDMPVIYGDIHKIKRGHYKVVYREVTINSRATNSGEITIAYNRMLEQTIINNPPYWLWSHKRWKHKRPITSKK